MNNDPENRFISMENRRVAANPIPRDLNPQSPALTVIADAQQKGPVLRESELLWLTHYMQALNGLEPPLPARVTVTGPRAAGFAQGDPLGITVVVDPSDQPSLEPRLAKIAAAYELVPSARPNILLLSPQQWANQQAGEAPEAHHNAWLAPHTKQLPNSPDDKKLKDGPATGPAPHLVAVSSEYQPAALPANWAVAASTGRTPERSNTTHKPASVNGRTRTGNKQSTRAAERPFLLFTKTRI